MRQSYHAYKAQLKPKLTQEGIFTHTETKPTTTNISMTIEAGKPAPVIENTNRHQPYKRTAYIYIYRNPKGKKKRRKNPLLHICHHPCHELI